MSDALVRRLAEDYSSSAGAYARLWGPAILPLALPLLEALPLAEARAVLDIGTGVGDLLRHLRTQAPEARVLGIDRSHGMISIARERHGLPVAVMDAVALGLPGDAFDVVTLVFVLFHIPRPLDALVEVGRVLRPGGTIGVVTWSEEDPGLPAAAHWAAELDRRGAEPDPRDDRVRRHGLVDRPDKLVRLLERAGYRSVQVRQRRFERRWDVDSLLRLQERCGSPGRRLATLEPDARAACVAAVRERLAAPAPEELVWRPVVLHASARFDGAPA